jgi:predicted transcriptional regulator
MPASNQSMTEIMAQRTTKSIRITEDAQRLLRLVAAFEDRTEGAIVEDALAAYLQIRSLGYEGVLPEARELAHTTPEHVGATVARLTSAIEQALHEGRLAPQPGDAKRRLHERAEQRAA